MAITVTRRQVDQALTAALLFNSVLAAFSCVVFFLSQWWLFLLLGTIGLPFTLGVIFLYRFTRLREPIKKYFLNFVVNLYEGIVQKRGMLIRKVYTAACWFVPSDEWKHINWGYATSGSKSGLSLNLDSSEEEKKFYNQLYHFMATGMGNWNTLEGKNLLEIKCGGGGGLNYICKHLNPDKCVGIDVSSTQMGYCQENSGQNSKIQFYAVDELDKLSQTPGLKEENIDLALSLQSSQYIRDFKEFVREVDNVLKPGGVFAFADMRLAKDWADIENDLQGSSLRIIKKEDISKNVIEALRLDELEKWQLINRRLGSIIRKVATSLLKRFGILKNNVILESLNSGTSQAMAYILLKPSSHQMSVQ